MLFRDPQILSNALAALGTIQPRAFGSLKHVDLLYLVSIMEKTCNMVRICDTELSTIFFLL